MGSCAKCLLITVNLAITLIGAGFFTAGAILRFAPEIVDGYIDLQELAERIPNYARSLGVQDVDSGEIDEGDADYTSFGPMSLVLMIMGGFVFITGFLGMCGACCINKCMLIAYIIIVVIGVLGQAIIIAGFTTDSYTDIVRAYLRDSLQTKYEGIDDYSIHGIFWNYIMLGYGCCGLDDRDDFDKAKKWKQNNERLIVIGGDSENATLVELEYPLACCKTKGSFPDKIRAKNESCAIDFTEQNSYVTGCWKKLKKDVETETITFGIVVGIFVFLQIFCAILAIVIICNNRNEKSSSYSS